MESAEFHSYESSGEEEGKAVFFVKPRLWESFGASALQRGHRHHQQADCLKEVCQNAWYAIEGRELYRNPARQHK